MLQKNLATMKSRNKNSIELVIVITNSVSVQLTVYSRVRLLWENFELASPKLVLGKPITKPSKFF